MPTADGGLRLGLVGLGRWGRRYLETAARVWPSGEVAFSDVATRSAAPAPASASAPRHVGVPRSAYRALGRPRSAAGAAAGGAGGGAAGAGSAGATGAGAARVWADWRELVRTAELDGLVVASPASTHFPIAAAALERGLPVLVEKPAALSAADTGTLLDLAGRAGRTVMVAHQHLHAPAFERLLAVVVAAAPPVADIECDAGGDGPVRDDCDALWDYAPHDLAMAIRLAGPGAGYTVESSSCAGAGGRQAWAFVVRADRTTIRVRVSNALQAKVRRLRVTLADGTCLTYDDRADDKLVADGRPLPVSDELPLDRLLRAFGCRIRGGDATTDDLALAVTIARILEDVQTRCRQSPASR